MPSCTIFPTGFNTLRRKDDGLEVGLLVFENPKAGALNTMNLEVSFGILSAIFNVVKAPKECPNNATDPGVPVVVPSFWINT